MFDVTVSTFTCMQILQVYLQMGSTQWVTIFEQIPTFFAKSSPRFRVSVIFQLQSEVNQLWKVRLYVFEALPTCKKSQVRMHNILKSLLARVERPLLSRARHLPFVN